MASKRIDLAADPGPKDAHAISKHPDSGVPNASRTGTEIERIDESASPGPRAESCAAGVALSTDLRDPNAIPYFLWDDPMTVRDVYHRLATASPPERDRLLGKILREAKDSDVWLFTTPADVAKRMASLSRHLGRRRRFWEFLLKSWREEGLLDG